MRLFILAIFTALLISTAPVSDEVVSQSIDRARTLAAGAFVNDSVVVEIQEEGPAEAPPETTVQAGEVTSGAHTPDENGGEGVQSQATIPNGMSPSADSSSDAQTQNIVPVVAEVEITTEAGATPNGETNSTAGPETASSGSATQTTTTTATATAEEILAALLGNQAVVARFGDGGGLFGNSTNGTDISFNADRIRSSLRARGITNLTIPNAGAILGATSSAGSRLTQSDFTLFLASALLRDENIEDVRLRDGEIMTEYRALGRLFGFVPLRYTLRVTVLWDIGTVTDVSVTFPWYKFFLQTGVSRSSLEALLESEVSRAIKGQEAEFDVATRAFTAVVETLSSRIGM